MVSSIINEKVNYIETKLIDQDDIKHSSSIYIIELYDVDTPIVLGKPKYIFMRKNIIYFPIYIINANTKKKSQIGVFEVQSRDTLKYIDQDGDIDIEKIGEPLLYSFATERYIKKNNSTENIKTIIEEYDNNSDDINDKSMFISHNTNKLHTKHTKSNNHSIYEALPDVQLGGSSHKSNEDDDNEEYDTLTLKVGSNKLSKQKKIADNDLKNGIFENIYEKQGRYRNSSEELLKEETEEDADKIKLKYKDSSRNNWIEKFMRNSNYDMMSSTSIMKDSLFISIIDAFMTIGKRTTIQKLKAVLSLHAQETFDNHLSFKEQFEDKVQSLENQLRELKRVNKIYSKRLNNIVNFEDKKEMVTELKKLGTTFELKKKHLREMLRIKEYEIGFMRDIDSLEKYREFIMSPKYCPDEWAIDVLEKQLNFKFIILYENAYEEKVFNSILNTKTYNYNHVSNENDPLVCNLYEDNNKHIDYLRKNNNKIKNKRFNPDYYIILSSSETKNGFNFTSNNKDISEKLYRLVSYYKKKILIFSEIPYDIKILVVNKCLEQNSGKYYLIEDFRNLKSQFGLDPDEGEPDNSDNKNYTDKYGLLSSHITFIFNNKCVNAKPGQASGEHISHDKRIDFVELSKRKEWRCHLDDMTTDFPMTIDKHRWASVEHYIQACKFKKGFPDFYRKFSLDELTELSKNSEMARQIGDIKKNKYKELRPAGIKIDIDYFLGRNLEEREKAIRAKFTQNEDLKETLILTYPAVLKHMERRKPPITDDILLKIRQEVFESQNLS